MKLLNKICLILLWLSVANTYLSATDVKAIPSFSVSDLDGNTVTSEKICPSGKCLFIYADAGSSASEALFDLLGKQQTFDVLKISIVLGNCSIENAKKLIDKNPALQRATWLLDQDNSAYKLMDLKGTPVVYGVRDGKIEWTFSGIHKNANTMKSILKDWIAEKRE
jgi:hypothetical protein